MQSSKPAQAGIIVAANYTKNTVCWPIIVPFRQTRCVITCQVLNINTVLVKYLRITMQIQRTHRGVLPYVGYNTLTLGARGFFHARFPVSASSETQGHESVALVEKARRKNLKTFVAPFLLTWLTAPGSVVSDSEDAVSVKSGQRRVGLWPPKLPVTREKREPLVPSAWVQYSSHLLKH